MELEAKAAISAPGEHSWRTRLGAILPSLARWTGWCAVIYAIAANAFYSFYGMATFPAQEWVLEATFSIFFLLPVLSWFKHKVIDAPLLVGLALGLVGHSVWDLMHWPALGQINTPIDPRLPVLCPIFDLGLAAVLITVALLLRPQK